MKNLTYRIFVMLALALSFSILVSCGGDDEDGDGPSGGDIVGTWNVTSASVDLTINGQDFVEYFIDELDLTPTEAEEFSELFIGELDEGFEGATITFNSDNTYEANFDGDTEDGSWARDGENLTVTSDGEASVFRINSLTASSLVLSFDETETEDFDEDGTDDVLKFSITLNLTK